MSQEYQERIPIPSSLTNDDAVRFFIAQMRNLQKKYLPEDNFGRTRRPNAMLNREYQQDAIKTALEIQEELTREETIEDFV